jgi:phosphoserine phosphatase
MKFSLVLVCAANKKLSTAHLAHIQSLLADMALHVGDAAPQWLCPHRAAELTLPVQLNQTQIDTIRAYTDPLAVDVFCIDSALRRKSLLMADMDSTIITDETLDAIADHAGIGEKVAAITARAMNGELDFEQALTERVALLKGQPTSLLKTVMNDLTLSSGAETLVRTMAKHGATCVLVSGGFTFFTEVVARRCGFAFHHGNNLDLQGESLAGTVSPPILDKHAKENYFNYYRKKLKLLASDSIAVGDGANDLNMLEAVGVGIGYYPKPKLEQALRHNIRYSDITALLYIQGYTHDQFVELVL